jgi:ketosteroid isomerase-like protein
MSKSEIEIAVRDGAARALGAIGLCGIALVHLLALPGKFSEIAPFFAIGGQMTSDVRKVVEGAGLATVLNRWTLEGAQPDGTPLRLGATSADVVRCQPDGRWLLVIDDPWGA